MTEPASEERTTRLERPDSARSTVAGRALAFLALAFGVSVAVWLPVVASARGWIGVEVPAGLAAVGIFGPAIAAIALRLVDDGRAGLRAIRESATRWRFGPRWWAATVLAPPAIVGGIYVAYLLVGGDVGTASTVTTIRDMGAAAAVAVPLLILVTVALAYGEELGWRGYLLPLLQTRLSALAASLVVGVAWFLWHVPLLYLPGYEAGGEAYPIALWAATVVLTSIVYTWLYNGTGGSVLAVSLFHAGMNVWGPLVALHPAETGDVRSAYVLAAGWGLVAIALVLVYGGETLSRSGHRPGLAVGDAE